MTDLTAFVTQWTVVVVFAGWVAIKRERLARRVRTTGTILGLQAGKKGTCAPIFSFRTIDGKELINRSSVATSPCPYKIGQTVEVLYDSANPERANINSFIQAWAWEIGLGVIVGMWFAVGLLMVLGVVEPPRK
jgi:hypothetical protein